MKSAAVLPRRLIFSGKGLNFVVEFVVVEVKLPLVRELVFPTRKYAAVLCGVIIGI